MSRRNFAFSIALLLLVLTCAGSAEAAGKKDESGPDIPHWPGQWQIVGATPNESGGFVETLEETVRTMKAWGPPPYKPQAQAVFDVIAKQVRDASKDALKSGSVPEVGRTCAFGFPVVMIHSPLMFEILATPEETALIFSGREIRHVYTDGRPHTSAEDLYPSLWGDSIGHWEGDTLVIDTIGVLGPKGPTPAVVAMGGGSTIEVELLAVLSSEARFIERIRMIDPDHLENQMTIIDPRVFTQPWKLNRRYSRVKSLNRMIHEDCQGEDRNLVVDGKSVLAPPPPRPRLPPPFEDPPATADATPAEVGQP